MSSFKFSRKGTIEYLEALPLARHDFLLHAFCTRRGGVSEAGFAALNFSNREGDGPENVRQNWELLAGAFQLDLKQFLVMHQRHGDSILVVNSADDYISQSFPAEVNGQFDALVTDRPGVALVVKTADCVPIFLVDIRNHVIGAVHAGWKGTALNISGKVIDTFIREFGSREEDILAAIGPAVGPCCYEVDGPVHRAMGHFAGSSSFLHPCPDRDRWMLDLVRVNRLQMQEKGILPEHLVSCGHCTSCHDALFFSHRRDGLKTGRHANFIMLKNSKKKSLT